MSMMDSGGEWYGSLPGTGRVYRLIDGAQNERNREGRIGAIIALGESGDPRAVRALMDCCRDQDPEIRMHAIKALCKLKSSRSVTVLIERLQDMNEDRMIRRRAAEALAAIRSYSAVEALKERLSVADEDAAIRSIARAIGEGRYAVIHHGKGNADADTATRDGLGE